MHERGESLHEGGESLHEAEEHSWYGWEVEAEASLKTDYIFRGISLTEEHPAIQGAVEILHESGFYAEFWASNVEVIGGEEEAEPGHEPEPGPETGHSIEYEIAAGFKNETDFGGLLPRPLGWDVGWLRLDFPSNSFEDFNEIYAGLNYSPLDWLKVSYKYHYGLRFEHKGTGDYQTVDLDIELPSWAWDMTLGLHGGSWDRKDAAEGEGTLHRDDYVEWKVSLEKELGGFIFEAAWHDTDGTEEGKESSIADDHFVFAITRELGGSHHARLPAGIDTSANLTLATDYIFRGISQTGNDPAVQGEFTVGHESGVYAGVWASNFDGPSNNNIELDFFTGIAGETGFGLGWDVGILRYHFPDASALNFNELFTGLSFSPLDILDLSANYFYGLKIEHRDPGQYVDLNADVDIFSWLDSASPVHGLLHNMKLGLHGGHYDRSRGLDDYWDWKVGVSKSIGAFNFEVAYQDTDKTEEGIRIEEEEGHEPSSGNIDDGRALFTVSIDL